MAAILAVDDEDVILKFIERTLVTEGHQVNTFSSPFEAIYAVQDNYFDLALLDISMPEMDGLKLGLEMKREGVPFLYVSAFSDEEVREKAKLAGAVECLVKPVRAQQLRISVEAALVKLSQPQHCTQHKQVQFDTINTAKGLIAHKHDLPDDEAYAWLREKARKGNREIFDVADDIVWGHNHYIRLMRGDSPYLKGKQRPEQRGHN